MRRLNGVMLGTLLGLMISNLNCATYANFIRPLSDRSLLISNDGPYTEYPHYVKCGLFKKCLVVERDFDFTKAEDRKKFNDMGFECAVRERP
jgi:hypothetical protein